jgi:hypothetical protein
VSHDSAFVVRHYDDLRRAPRRGLEGRGDRPDNYNLEVGELAQRFGEVAALVGVRRDDECGARVGSHAFLR